MIEVSSSSQDSLVSVALVTGASFYKVFYPSQVMFEEYQCAGVYIAIQAVLTLYAQGGSHDCHVIYITTHTPQFTVLHSCFYMEYSHMGRRESGCFVKISCLCF